jgi:hypothetical protein
MGLKTSGTFHGWKRKRIKLSPRNNMNTVTGILGVTSQISFYDTLIIMVISYV